MMSTMKSSHRSRLRRSTKYLCTALALGGLLLSSPSAEAQDVEAVCNLPLFGLVIDQNNPQHPQLRDHFYTVSGAERQAALTPTGGAQASGLIPDSPNDLLEHLAGNALGYLSAIPMSGGTGGFADTTPLYQVRLQTSTQRDSLLTTDLDEAMDAIVMGYDALGSEPQLVGHVLDRPSPRPLYRLFNQMKNDHAYATSALQKQQLEADDRRASSLQRPLGEWQRQPPRKRTGRLSAATRTAIRGSRWTDLRAGLPVHDSEPRLE